jgi:hypothetical protein
LKNFLKPLSLHALLILGTFVATAPEALSAPQLRIKSALPESESKATAMDSAQVYKEESKTAGASWKGTGTLKIGSWESLVLVKDQQGVEIARDPKDETEYTVKLTLLGEDTSFEVVRVLADGKSQTLFLEFSYPEWTDPNPDAQKNMQLEPTKTTVSIGPTSFVYQEQGTDNFSSVVLTLKASNRLELVPKKIDLGTNFFVSLFPLTKNDPERTARFFGLNVRIGRALWEKPGQKLSLHLGVYYTTMLTSVSGSASPFGFADLMGPQLYPTYSRAFPFGILSTYFKFSPVGRGVTVAPLDSREIAMGIAWVRPHKKEYNLVFSLDYSNFKTQLPLGEALQEVSNNSLSFAGGIEF